MATLVASFCVANFYQELFLSHRPKAFLELTLELAMVLYAMMA